MRWPLGSRLSPQVIRLQGWANLFIGCASLVLAVLAVALPGLLSSPTVPARWIVFTTVAIAVDLLICGLVPYVRSVRLSRL